VIYYLEEPPSRTKFWGVDNLDLLVKYEWLSNLMPRKS
jgi:hypothetical protein